VLLQIAPKQKHQRDIHTISTELPRLYKFLQPHLWYQCCFTCSSYIFIFYFNVSY